MTELPSGTVTFLFTDMEGSTGLLKQLGEGYADVLAAHQTILREAFAASEGHEIDTQGDSFFVAFRRAKDAVAAAIDGQRRLASHHWPDDVDLRVRMGVHSGEPLVQPDTYVGLGVHRAARIMAAAHGGQILVSNATRELIEDDLGPNVSLRDLEEHRLKDIDRPQRLFQVVADGLATEFPPVRSQVAESAFSGLEEELAAAAHAAVGTAPRNSRRLLAAGLGVAVIAAAVTAGIFVLGRGDAAKAQPHIEPNSAVALDARNGKVLASVPVESGPVRATAGAGALWVANANAGTVSRIDPQTRAVVQTIDVGSGPAGIAFGGGAVWVTCAADGTLVRIDAGSNKVVDTIPGLQGPRGVAYGEGAVWVASLDDRVVLRIDPTTDLSVRKIPTGGTPTAIAVGEGSVWVTNESGSSVSRIDPATNTLAGEINVGNGPSAIAVGLGSVWVANTLDGNVSRINPRTGTVTALVPVGEAPRDIAVARDAVWVVNEFTGTVSRIDPASNRVTASTPVGNRPTGISVGGGIWVTVRPAGGAHRGGTFTDSVVASAIDWIDPAMAYTAESWQILSLTGDGLTAFKRVGGSEGATVVADLATALPTPTDGGTTYTFQLRDGIRYSTGALVKSTDIRRSFERLFEIGSNGAKTGYYASILGASSCKRGKHCDLSRGIVVTGRSIVFHLSTPEPEFRQRLALPFAFVLPATTPRRAATRPLPATGPYVIVRYDPKREVKLARNPHFHEWSRAAHPDGYPDEVVMKIGLSRDAATTAVERGSVDYTGVSSDRISEVATRYAPQLHTYPIPQTNYLILNTQAAPFNSVAARRALSYALDRREMVQRGSGGSQFAQPTCQILPPNFPGYVPYCPYTIDPLKTGRWLAPDLAKASALINRSRTRGMRITVLGENDAYAKSTAKYVVGLLKRLGYKASRRALSYKKLARSPAFSGATKNAQIILASWYADYPSAAAFIQPSLSCGGGLNDSGFCDPALDRQMRRAQTLEPTNPRGADALWTQIDHQLVDSAPWIPYFTPKESNFVSKRVGNVQFHPQWLLLFDQLWVR